MDIGRITILDVLSAPWLYSSIEKGGGTKYNIIVRVKVKEEINSDILSEIMYGERLLMLTDDYNFRTITTENHPQWLSSWKEIEVVKLPFKLKGVIMGINKRNSSWHSIGSTIKIIHT